MKSSKLKLPFLEPAQALKYVTVNEVIQTLDVVVQLSAIATVSVPPSGETFVKGHRYIVGSGAQGKWLGQENAIAVATDADWVFLTPENGWQCWCEDEQSFRVFSDSKWIGLTDNQKTSKLRYAPSQDPVDMPGEIIGPIDPHTFTLGRDTITLIPNRVYLSLIRVDRLVEFTGAAISIITASNEANRIIRAALHEVDVSAQSGIKLQDQVLDLGTVAADHLGHHTFRPSSSQHISPGWYASVLATQAVGVEVRYHKWLTPGTTQYVPFSSGATADFRTSGLSVYGFANVSASVIETGFDRDWSSENFISAQTPQPTSFQFILPVFKP